MAIVNNVGDRSKGDFNRQLLIPNCGLSPCRPSPTKGSTTIRIIPEIAPDGSIRPMVLGTAGVTAKGKPVCDFSNMLVENVVMNAGAENKFTGVDRASDQASTDAIDGVFGGAFIKLRGRQKKNELGPVHDIATRLLEKKGDGKIKRSDCAPVKEMVFVQAIVKKLNDKVLDKVAARQVVILTATAIQDIGRVLTDMYERGEDIFSPAGGRWIELVPQEQRVADLVLFEAVIGDPCPLSEEQCRQLWVPWDRVIRRYTTAEMLQKAIECYGYDVVRFVHESKLEQCGMLRVAPVHQSETPVSRPKDHEKPVTQTAKPENAGTTLALDLSADLSGESSDDDGDGGASAGGSSAPSGPVPTDPRERAAYYRAQLERR